MRESQVQSLVWEDPTCHEATKPSGHNSWACALEPSCCNYWSPGALQPVVYNVGSHAAWTRIRTCLPQLEKRPHSSKDQAQLKKRHPATKTDLLFLGNSHLTENPYFYLLNSVILLTIRIPRLKKSAFSLALFDISRYWGRGRLKGRRGDFCYPDQVGIRQFVHSAGERKQSETVLVWGLP